MKKIIFTRPDGGLSIVTPARSEEEAWKKLPKDAINPKWIDDSVIPKDRSFRNAWKDDGVKIEHDIMKCRNITKERLRIERAPKLAALDIEFQRAIEEGRPTDDIVAKKNALRDITKQVDGVVDLEILKAIKA